VRLGLTTLVATAIAAAGLTLASTPAWSTALCEDDPRPETACEFPYEEGTTLVAKSTAVTFTTPFLKVTCNSSLEVELTQDPTTEWMSLEGQLTDWSFTECTNSSSTCSVEAPAPVPVMTQWTEGIDGTVNFSEKELSVMCTGSPPICTYLVSPTFKLSGGEASKATLVVENYVLTRLFGLFCPKKTTLSASYTFEGPQAGLLFAAAQALKPTVYCKSNSNPCPKAENFGKTNLEAKLVAPATVKFRWQGQVRDTCSVSVLKGTTEKLGFETLGRITELSFAQANCTCKTEALRLPWKSKLGRVAPGVGVFVFESGGAGKPAFKMENCNGQTCTFADEIFPSFNGGNPSRIDFGGQTASEVAGACGQLEIENTTGRYQVEVPSSATGAWVEPGA
jgi:hypothetical protein